MLNVAVCGLGWWGRTLVPLLQASAKLSVVATADPQAPAIDGLPLEKDFDKVLRNPAVQGVVLCTPHTLHADQIVKASQAGKHVFCEKPLSLSRADVLRAVDSCKKNKVALAVGHEMRFEPPVLELFRILQSGEIGAPLQIEANFSQDKFLALKSGNWRLSGKEAPAGPLTATAIHLLDLSVGVFGPARRAFASVRQLGSGLTNGDTLAVVVDFGKGHALLSAVLATPFDCRFAVYGSKGWVEVRDKAHPEAPQGSTLTVVTRNSPSRKVIDYPPAKAVLSNLEAFADAATGGAPYPVPQEQMIANVSALEAIVKSARSGKVEEVDS
jgi:predicted dehydrogenase